MKHYPAPWIIAPRACRYRIADEEKVEICKRHGFAVEFDALGIADSKEEKTIAVIPLDDSNMFNAYLIAAAPELLEMCKKALDHCLTRGQPNLQFELEDLIAKIEGKKK